MESRYHLEGCRHRDLIKVYQDEDNKKIRRMRQGGDEDEDEDEDEEDETGSLNLKSFREDDSDDDFPPASSARVVNHKMSPEI